MLIVANKCKCKCACATPPCVACGDFCLPTSYSLNFSGITSLTGSPICCRSTLTSGSARYYGPVIGNGIVSVGGPSTIYSCPTCGSCGYGSGLPTPNPLDFQWNIVGPCPGGVGFSNNGTRPEVSFRILPGPIVEVAKFVTGTGLTGYAMCWFYAVSSVLSSCADISGLTLGNQNGALCDSYMSSNPIFNDPNPVEVFNVGTGGTVAIT